MGKKKRACSKTEREKGNWLNLQTSKTSLSKGRKWTKPFLKQILEIPLSFVKTAENLLAQHRDICTCKRFENTGNDDGVLLEMGFPLPYLLLFWIFKWEEKKKKDFLIMKKRWLQVMFKQMNKWRERGEKNRVNFMTLKDCFQLNAVIHQNTFSEKGFFPLYQFLQTRSNNTIDNVLN